MKKMLRTSSVFLLGLLLCSCSEMGGDQTLGHQDGPQITIETIWINGTAYEPADTIVISGASEVKIDYTVTSQSDLFFVNDYYVSGTSGSLLKTNTREEIAETSSSRNFSGQLECRGFLPFRCAFRIVAADGYGGAASTGFYLKLPVSGLGEVSGNTATQNHNNRNFGPGQTDGNSASLGKTINNVKANGRYTQYDMCYSSSTSSSQDRAGSNDLGLNYVNGKLVMFSPSRFDELFPLTANPAYAIRYFTDVNKSDITVTKFQRLDLFTNTMWGQCTTVERINYLADSFKATTTEEIVYPEALGYYFFTAKSPLYEWHGLIYIKSLGTPTTYAQFDLRTFKYWP